MSSQPTPQQDAPTLIAAFFHQVINLDQYSLSAQQVEALSSVQAILTLSTEEKKHVLLALPQASKAERTRRSQVAKQAQGIKAALDRGDYPDRSVGIAQLLALNTGGKPGTFCLFDGLAKLRSKLSQTRMNFSPQELTTLVKDIAEPITTGQQITNEHVLLRPVLLAAESATLTDETKAQLDKLAQAIRHNIDKSIQRPKDAQQVIQVLESLLGITKPPDTLPLNPGDGWSDIAIAHLQSLPTDARAKWNALFDHARTLKTARPSGVWRKRALALINDIGVDAFTAAIILWLDAVQFNRNTPLIIPPVPQGEWSRDVIYAHTPPELAVKFLDPDNAQALRGLALAAGVLKSPGIIRALGGAILSAYIKIPGVGCRSAILGNACILALSDDPTHDSLIQLDLARNKVKYVQAQKLLYKAFNDAATAMGISQDQLADMIVSDYGLDASGKRIIDLGAAQCHFEVSNQGDVSLSWVLPSGKTQASIPAQVKTDKPAELKELTKAAKEAQSVLTVQKNRIEATYLTGRTWSLADWQKHIAGHPLVGTLARRLIWSFQTPGTTTQLSAMLHDGKLIDASGSPVSPAPNTLVRLWHPLFDSAPGVQAWRQYIESHQIVQPFKQAHREVYLLTDAERRTNTYSNRFAAHIIRQHQFKALCDARAWGFDLHIPHADTGAGNALKPITAHRLVAEYFVMPAVGAGIAGSGVALYLVTDQVRFLSADDMTNPLPLESIDPLVMSEVFRDVDLFVGVASVGNDTNWADSGAQPGFQNYWESYSFGDLSVSAESRRDLLKTIIPRLKITPLCSFTDKFLVVKGKFHTYKIHFGSGNIQMEPSNQYLCIVPSSSAGKTAGAVYLPFEGDRTLSIILSKAIMLAADDKITDPTITRQISP
jgi:hypothetical protein